MAKRKELKDFLGRDLLKEVGFNLMPRHIMEKSVPELLDLQGRKAVVTGAGGPGLGQACANRLAGCGADVAVVDIDLEGARRVAEQVADLWGTRVFPVHGNITDWDDAQRFMRESHDKLGGLDILVNNAIATPAAGEFEKFTKEQIDSTVHGLLT